MSVRPITAADENLLASWYVARGLPIIPSDVWPKNGYIVDECVAGFLLCTDSKYALAEWIISKPGYDKIKRRTALKELIATLGGRAMEQGYKMLGVLSANESLLSLFKEDGFQTDSTKLTSLYRRLF